MGRLSFRKFLAEQWDPVPPVEHTDLSGKIVLVVGANVGLGFEAAKHFARMNPGKLVLACRTYKKADEAAQAIREVVGATNTESRAVDLSSFESVNRFAEEYVQDGGRLDIFVYNAGVSFQTYALTGDGWETSLQVNDLSSMLLTVLLFPAMLKSASSGSSPRAVIVSSDTHYWSRILPDQIASPNILEKLNDADYCSSPNIMTGRYALSKLINVLFVRELTARLAPDSPLIINAVNPGLCHSNLRRNTSFSRSLFGTFLLAIAGHTAEEGSRDLIWASVGGRNRENELRGAYVSGAGLKEVSDFVLSDEGQAVQKRIFDEAVAILSDVSPRFSVVLTEVLSK
ncbi:hypothetical protein BC834DRAFT_855024 [Gloeopeniophorella convolvens]|nr:hypothetical protein BC834DRAFT_855024 [Gloeopeniophorella convolvens]